MSKVPSIVPISDLREDAANILSRMKNSHEPVVITQRGRAAAVMVSIEEYERSTHEREILRLLARVVEIEGPVVFDHLDRGSISERVGGGDDAFP